MIDLQHLRKNISTVAEQLATRGYTLDITTFKKLEAERKRLQTYTQTLQEQRNRLSKQIGILKSDTDHPELSNLMTTVATTGEKLTTYTAQLESIQQQLTAFVSVIPNLPHDSVPIGKDESANVLLRTIGTPPTFSFPARDHVEIGSSLGLDFAVATQLTGTRFCLMKGGVAHLHRALAQFMLDTHIAEHGYTECYTPHIVNAASLYGTGQLPKFESDLFSVKKGGQEEPPEQALFLIPTAEVTLTNTVREQILSASDLPIKLTAHTPCFRSEAGSYGRDTRGIIRQHQFDKIELVQIVHPEHSCQALEEMIEHAENILKKLELPYRAVTLCTGDMGFSAMKTYDIEVWLPAQNTYREISSISNTGDFQARRMQARFRETTKGKPELVHTLNGSGLAVGRTLVAILENYQQTNGSVAIPKVLQSYMNCDVLNRS